MGFSLVPATIVAMQCLPASQSGIGSGLLNTSRLMGGALGLAILSTIADSQTRADASSGFAHALTSGFDLAFGVGAAFALAGAMLAGLRLRNPAPAELAALEVSAGDEGGDRGGRGAGGLASSGRSSRSRPRPARSRSRSLGGQRAAPRPRRRDHEQLGDPVAALDRERLRRGRC